MSRERLPRQELIRIVADSQGRVHVDLEGAAPGRGAWLQPDEAMFRRVERDPRPLKRSLRRKRLHAEGLLAEARKAVADRVELELELCHRAGVLRAGSQAVARTAAAELIVVAADATMPADPSTPHFRVHLDREELGLLLGRGPRARAALLASRPSRRLRRWLQWQARLGYGVP